MHDVCGTFCDREKKNSQRKKQTNSTWFVNSQGAPTPPSPTPPGHKPPTCRLKADRKDSEINPFTLE